jgi:hypothetical protein
MPTSSFYDAGPLKQLAINLFHGWGYNFYRTENQLRADDLLIRSKVGWLLGLARKSVESAESEYRREKLPPPSRAHPRPEPDAMAGAQMIERLSKALGSLQGLISAQPVPENDRMTQRYRQEGAILQKLIESDEQLIGQSELLRSLLDQKTGEWLIENASTIQEGLQAIGETLRHRQALLH